MAVTVRMPLRLTLLIGAALLALVGGLVTPVGPAWALRPVPSVESRGDTECVTATDRLTAAETKVGARVASLNASRTKLKKSERSLRTAVRILRHVKAGHAQQHQISAAKKRVERARKKVRRSHDRWTRARASLVTARRDLSIARDEVARACNTEVVSDTGVSGVGEVEVDRLQVIAGPEQTVTVTPPVVDSSGWEGFAAFMGSGLMAGRPSEISLDGPIGPDGVEISKTYPVPLPDDFSATLAYYDEATGLWTPVPTTISDDRLRITTTTHHLSVWDDFVSGSQTSIEQFKTSVAQAGGAVAQWSSDRARDIGQGILTLSDAIYYSAASVFDKRVDPPTCHGGPPSWLHSSTFTPFSPNNPVHWCVGDSPANADVLVVKARVNRGYPMPYTTSTPTVTNSIFGIEDLRGALAALSSADEVVSDLASLLLGGGDLGLGGAELTFTFTRAQVEAVEADPSTIVQFSYPHPAQALLGILTATLVNLGFDETEGALAAAIGIASCVGDASQQGDITALAKAVATCVRSAFDEKKIASFIGAVYADLYRDADPAALGAKAARATKALNLSMLLLPGVVSGWSYATDMLADPGQNLLRATAFAKPDADPPTSSARWSSLAANRRQTCGIREDGSAWCWGLAWYKSADDKIVNLTPSRIIGTGSGRWTAVSVGGRHVCGVKADATAWCWGENDQGQVGIDWVGQELTDPQRLPGRWRSVVTGYDTTCGIQTDGTGWCWGNNSNGQLGDGSAIDRRVPTRVLGGGMWETIALGLRHGGWTYDRSQTCGIKTDGTAWCWGDNTSGQLGDGTTISRSSPTQIAAAGPWTSIATARHHTCAIRDDGSAWCWGMYGEGVYDKALGYPTYNVDTRTPHQVRGNSEWTALSPNWSSTCGLRDDASVWCWGDNSNGQLGVESTSHPQDLVPVASGMQWTMLERPSGGSSTCALRADDTAWCWGAGWEGMLGWGGNSDRDHPTQVLGGGAWSTVVMSREHTCGIKKDDATAWCWGRNFYGTLGDGTTVDRNIPTPVGGAS